MDHGVGIDVGDSSSSLFQRPDATERTLAKHHTIIILPNNTRQSGRAAADVWIIEKKKKKICKKYLSNSNLREDPNE